MNCRIHLPASLRALGAAVILGLAFGITACGDTKSPDPDSAPDRDLSAPAADGMPVFRDVTGLSGIAFVHRNGATGSRWMPECMGSGVAVLDFDGDGLPDLYFVDSGALGPAIPRDRPGSNRLFKNLGKLHFEDVTARARVPGRGYGMGAVAGDYDADGDPDLYVTGFGPNVLYRNEGDGTFRDVTEDAGVDDPRWSTGAAFLDFDGDGDLDLIVQGYVDYGFETHRNCYLQGREVYATPDQYEGIPARLFSNRGDGTFEDVSTASGISAHLGKGLGVCVGDFDRDGDADVYCANDTMMNFLFENRGGGRFEEIGLISGAGYSEHGKEEAGMGVDAADIDGDGLLDLVVTNFQREANALYRNEGDLAFTEISADSGTALIAHQRLGFGVRFLDFDHDGVQDLLVANGHIYDNGDRLEPPVPHAQPPSLFRGLGGGRFEEVTTRAGAWFSRPIVGRGLATADLDQDGDLDAVFTVNDGPAKLFENVGGNARAWVVVRLVGAARSVIGARVTVDCGGRTQVQEVRSGGSYLSQGDQRLHFGLGDATRIECLRVRWPVGREEEARDVPVRRHLVFREGRGLVR